MTIFRKEATSVLAGFHAGLWFGRSFVEEGKLERKTGPPSSREQDQ